MLHDRIAQWMAATAALCALAPSSSVAQPKGQPWPPNTPYDTPSDDMTPAKPDAKKPAAKRPDQPHDAPPDETAPPGGKGQPGAPGGDTEPDDETAGEAPPPTITPPPAGAAPAPAPAAPLTSLPAPATAAPPPPAPAPPPGPPGQTAPPHGYGQPQQFQPGLPPAVPLGGAQGQPDSATGTDWRLIGGLTSVGLGAGMFVVMGVSAARISSIQDEPAFEKYRSGFTADQSVCEQAAAGQQAPVVGAATARAADDLCSEADTLEIVTYVSIGAGAALLGLGGYLVFTSDTVSGDTATLTIDPRVGPGHGSMQLTYRF